MKITVVIMIIMILCNQAYSQNCANTSEGLTPLMDLSGSYNDSTGGLYGGGSNTIPADHDSIGQIRAGEVAPRDTDGVVDWSGTGKIGVVMLGGSLIDRPTFFLKDTLSAQAMIDKVRAEIVVVNVGVPGTGNLHNVIDTSHTYWTTHVTDSLSDKNITRDQVQVAVFGSIQNESGAFDNISGENNDSLKVGARRWQNYFPNLKLLLVYTLQYGGYGEEPNPGNQEPTWYERSGFGQRGAILASARQEADMSPIKDANDNGVGNGMGEAACMFWLADCYADGTTQRSDGLDWICPDDYEDGGHLDTQGRRKMVLEWLEFLEGNPIGATWWLRNSGLLD